MFLSVTIGVTMAWPGPSLEQVWPLPPPPMNHQHHWVLDMQIWTIFAPVLSTTLLQPLRHLQLRGVNVKHDFYF